MSSLGPFGPFRSFGLPLLASAKLSRERHIRGGVREDRRDDDDGDEVGKMLRIRNCEAKEQQTVDRGGLPLARTNRR